MARLWTQNRPNKLRSGLYLGPSDCVVDCICRIRSWSVSANKTERFAWQEEQKFLVWQEKASRCSSLHEGQRIRAKPPRSRPQSKKASTVGRTTGRSGPALGSY